MATGTDLFAGHRNRTDVPPENELPNYLPKTQAARLAGCSERTIESKIKDGTLLIYPATNWVHIDSLLPYALVNQAKRFARIEAEQIDLELQRIKLKELQNQVIDIADATQLGTEIGTIFSNSIDDIVNAILPSIAKTKRSKVQQEIKHQLNSAINSIADRFEKLGNNG